MVNFLFLVDTSYMMSTKVGEYGLTLLELCKTAIHRSVNNRRKSVSKPTDSNNTSKFNHKYLLVTYSSTSSVQCGWENSTDYFLKAIESLHATDSPNFGSALSSAFRLLQSNPNQLFSYGQGWKSWQNEMNVIMILTYCIDSATFCSKSIQHKRNEILRLLPRNQTGDELETDYIQWNTRIFVGNINVFGTLQMDTQTNSIRDALNNLCLETSSTDAIHVINNELHSLGQIERWVSAIMRDNCRDGVMVEFWDSSKEETEDDATIGKFNDGQLFREFLIATHCDAKWPIPEAYSPKEHHHELPPRRCRPQIAISRAQKGAACLPRSEWNVPYEQYEITSPRLRDFLVHLPHTMCYYAYIQHSAGAKFNFAKPWGTLKGDPKRNKAFLYVFVYDFPFVWNQISVFLQAKKRNFHNFSADEWKRAVGAYLNFIPAYYVQSVKDLLMQTTKGVHLPSFPSSSSLDPSIMSYISETQRKWRGNSDYRVKMNNKKKARVDDGDVSMDDEGTNECTLHGFPFECESDEEEQSDELLNAITKKKNHKEKKNELKSMDLEVPFTVNTRKRNWSQQNEENVYSKTRKRRKRFYEKYTQHKHNRDDELIAYVAQNDLSEVMNDLTLSVFGDAKKKKKKTPRKDSFDVTQDAQNKLLNSFANTLSNGASSTVYGHCNANAWKNQYKLILDQKEADERHAEKHNNMGNYTMYTERLRLAKKEEFRNPFQIETEYSNYALSLSFIFLQQKIHQHPGATKKKKAGKSFLETEWRLKSDKLLSIDEVLAIKKQTSEALWTKNEISTRFYEENEDRMPIGDVMRYQHSLLKSADWLSCQVLHNLKPTNLGGNPFKKRRKKSPFPLVAKPRIHNINVVGMPQQKQKEEQSKFEEEMASSLPHLSGLIDKAPVIEEEPVIEQEIAIETAPKPPQISPPPPPQISPPPPPPQPSKAKKVNASKLKTSNKKPVIPKPIVIAKAVIAKPKIDITQAINNAKRRQKIRQRPTQILPRRRQRDQSSSNSSSSISPEPVAKKPKLSNGVNGVIKMKGNEKKNQKKKAIQIVNTNHHHMNGLKPNKAQTTHSQAMNVLTFMQKYRQMVRSQNKFDQCWFDDASTCLNGLTDDTKTSFYQLLMNEAETYNRYQLAQNILKMYKNTCIKSSSSSL
eukprot:440178_1